MRTEDWSQSKDKDDEFSQYYLNEHFLSRQEYKILFKDLLFFNGINDHLKRREKLILPPHFSNDYISNPPVLIVQMDDIGIQMNSYFNEKVFFSF